MPTAPADGRRAPARGAPARPAPDPVGRWLTALAFTVVALPFVVALVALLPPVRRPTCTLADDLALIDLHTRRALAWKQQLGRVRPEQLEPPGTEPSSTCSRWSTGCLGAAPGRCSSGRPSSTVWPPWPVWASSATAAPRPGRCGPRCGSAGWSCCWPPRAPAATTYSETVLGALVSPWNPMVVILPLLLVVLLCAGADGPVGPVAAGRRAWSAPTSSRRTSPPCRSWPLVGVVAGLVWLVTAVVDLVRTRRGERSRGAPAAWAARRHWIVGPVLAVGGLAVLVVMWIPPAVPAVSNNPGQPDPDRPVLRAPPESVPAGRWGGGRCCPSRGSPSRGPRR